MIPLLLILAIGAQQVPEARYPVRWTQAVGPPSRQALQLQLERPVNVPFSFKVFEPDEWREDEEREVEGREIRTCADYARAKRKGWPQCCSNFEQKMEVYFKSQCDVPTLVLAAKSSRVSYIENFKLDAAALALLPPSLSPIAEMEGPEKTDAAGRRGISWKKYEPGLKLIATGPNWMTVEDKGSRIDLEIEAFGDFNGDGVEDVLLFESIHAIGGSFHSFHVMVLTRTSARGYMAFSEVKPGDTEKALPK